MQHTAAATTHQQSEKNPKKPAKSTLLSLPQQSLTTDHVCSTWLRETGQLRENSDLLYPMREGTLFQSYKCKCANKRLEHFIHWHWHQLHEKSKCSTSVNTFIEKYSFHSSNVKPGWPETSRTSMFCLYCFTELRKIFVFISPFIFIQFHFRCRWLKVAAGSPAGLKPSHACWTAATRQISQLPQTTSLWSFPLQSYKAPASTLVSRY